MHSFPRLTDRYAISPGLGSEPVWAPDGRRIYYRSGAGVHAVDVTTEPSFSAGEPVVLFEDPRLGGNAALGWVRDWDVRPDGEGFVMLMDEERTEAEDAYLARRRLTDVVLVVNWFEELRARMGN